METMIKKHQPFLDVKLIDVEGEFEGYASVFGGEPDAYGDVIASGAYADSLAKHEAMGSMPKMLWQHDAGSPIGKWKSMREDEKGLWVHGRLNMGVQRGKEAYALLKAGDIDGLSIGYKIKEYSSDEETGIWTLEKIDLHEVSVVTMPASDMSLVNSVKAARAAHELTERLKAGDQLTGREFELFLKGLGLSNSQAERAVRIHLNGQGDPAKAVPTALDLIKALKE